MLDYFYNFYNIFTKYIHFTLNKALLNYIVVFLLLDVPRTRFPEESRPFHSKKKYNKQITTSFCLTMPKTK